MIVFRLLLSDPNPVLWGLGLSFYFQTNGDFISFLLIVLFGVGFTYIHGFFLWGQHCLTVFLIFPPFLILPRIVTLVGLLLGLAYSAIVKVTWASQGFSSSVFY